MPAFQTCAMSPSTNSSLPVMKQASSEARNATGDSKMALYGAARWQPTTAMISVVVHTLRRGKRLMPSTIVQLVEGVDLMSMDSSRPNRTGSIPEKTTPGGFAPK